jgi:formylglycine-generating enzyme required for sulfatase activity
MKTRIKVVISFFFLIACLSSSAQKVSNVRAEQNGQEIVVLYSLEATFPCEVSLLLSQDNGVVWSAPLRNVSGDVGKYIFPGKKQINWKVIDERGQLFGDKIKFKVVASGRKSFEPEVVFVEGGTFKMGSSTGDSWEKPVHSVTLNAFNIGKYEVTQAQWESVMGTNPSYFKNCDNCPVESVSWNDVQQYITKLNSQTGKSYRLPTEAEWEYAAKGGKSSKGYTYSGSNDLNSVAWYHENSGRKTHSVGGKQANELGIYDMAGNVREWCSDYYGNYNRHSQTNPTGASWAESIIVRGCSWSPRDNCSVSARWRGGSDQREFDFGFRLVLPAVR